MVGLSDIEPYNSNYSTTMNLSIPNNKFFFIVFTLLCCCQLLTAQNFITRWDLSKSGSGATQISFGVATSGTVNYTWATVPAASSGSGTFTGSTATITGLPANATIRLQILPTNFQRIIINYGTNKERLVEVEAWGSVNWTSMQNAFTGCSNLQVTAIDIPNLSNVSNMSYMFSSCSILSSISNINSWNVITVNNMAGLFSNTDFNQNIANWNISNVNNLSGMFYSNDVFNQNIGSWNTGNVVDMSSMFSFAKAFNQDIGSWNTSKVTNMRDMFNSAENFNQNIGSWNTALVTDMDFMFAATKVFNQNIGGWNTSAVTDMSYMFQSAEAFNQNIGTWNTGSVKYMQDMFYLSKAFNQDIGSWNTSAVTNMSYMFCKSQFNQNIGNWNTSAVTNMSYMFAGSYSPPPYNILVVTPFNQNLGNWILKTGADMSNMFDYSSLDCSNYSSTLIGWNANPITPTGRNLGALRIKYGSHASVARANLVLAVSSGGKGWTISDGGLNTTTCGAAANTISTPIFTGTAFCAGTTVSVSFTTTGTFANGNQFNILLSDANGSFNSPQTIGTITSAGSVVCTIPTNSVGGENYRVKVVSTNPVVFGNDNNAPLTVNPQIWNLVNPTNNISSSNTTKKAIQTINASNSISGVSIVEYKAGNSVNLTAGFQVVSSAGSSFKVSIGGCN